MEELLKKDPEDMVTHSLDLYLPPFTEESCDVRSECSKTESSQKSLRIVNSVRIKNGAVKVTRIVISFV